MTTNTPTTDTAAPGCKPHSERMGGYRAAAAGASSRDCPHKIGTRARTSWLRGFWDWTVGRPENGRGGSYESERRAEGKPKSPSDQRRGAMRKQNKKLYANP